MRNRAKCKLCESILESFHETDYVTCKCGEISITGGEKKYECMAKEWANFLRVDDEGNEIVPFIQEEENTEGGEEFPPPTFDQLVDMLEEMHKNIDRLPDHAKSLPVSHYDHYSLILLLAEILKKIKSLSN